MKTRGSIHQWPTSGETWIRVAGQYCLSREGHRSLRNLVCFKMEEAHFLMVNSLWKIMEDHGKFQIQWNLLFFQVLMNSSSGNNWWFISSFGGIFSDKKNECTESMFEIIFCWFQIRQMMHLLLRTCRTCSPDLQDTLIESLTSPPNGMVVTEAIMVKGNHPHSRTIPGWWLGTFFPYIGYNHPNWLIFFRGVETTNQILFTQIPYQGDDRFYGTRCLMIGYTLVYTIETSRKVKFQVWRIIVELIAAAPEGVPKHPALAFGSFWVSFGLLV